MSERQPNINNKPSRLARVAHNKLFQGVALTGMGGVAALAIAGAKDAHADYHAPVLDSKDTHSQSVNNQNSNSQIEVGGIKSEVTGFPQFKTVRSSEADASSLASQLGEEITFAVPEGSNVNDQIHNQVLKRTGADLSGAKTWELVTEVGGSTDSLVFPGEVKTYKVNESAVSTIQDADVEVTVAVKAAPAAVETQEAAASGTNISDQSENVVDPTPTPGSVTEASVANSETTPADCIPTDLKGHFVFIDADKNIVGNPSRLHLENVQPLDRQYCDDNVWIRSFGSTQNPYSSGWLENQTPIISQITIHNSDGTTTLTSTAEGMVNIPNNTNDLSADINVTETKYCWVQIEAVRTSIIDPKVYSGVNMINYALYPNPDMDPVTCQVRPTVTPTNTETSTVTLTPTSTNTPEVPTSTNTPEVGCIVTDVKGELNDLEDSNHLTGNPVKGKVSNIATNLTCSDDIYIHMYGSMQKPAGTGQNIGLNIESQKGNHILTKQIIVPENTVDMPIEVTIPQNKFCTVQVDLTRDGAIKDEPRYLDNDFLLFVDEENCNPKTDTPTATASPTVTLTSTATNTMVPESTNTPNPTNTARSTKTPRHEDTSTATNTPVNTPTATKTAESTSTRVPEKAGVQLPKTGTRSESGIAPWIEFGIGALGVVGLSSVGKGLYDLITVESKEDKKKKKERHQTEKKG